MLITIGVMRGSKGFKIRTEDLDATRLSYYSLLRRSCSSGAGRTLLSQNWNTADSQRAAPDAITQKYPEVTVLPRPEELRRHRAKMPVYSVQPAAERSRKSGYEYDTHRPDITSPAPDKDIEAVR